MRRDERFGWIWPGVELNFASRLEMLPFFLRPVFVNPVEVWLGIGVSKVARLGETLC